MKNEELLSNMIGRTFSNVHVEGDVLYFEGADTGPDFVLEHLGDCCESVELVDVCGDISDLSGAPVLIAEEVDGEGDPAMEEHCESFTWTFYKFSTIKGSVTLRWFGQSNGYYSESVDIGWRDAGAEGWRYW